MNPNYKKIDAVPLDISLRDEIGVSVDVDDFNKLPEIVEELLSNQEFYKEKITRVVEENIYNIGSAAKAGGEYIIQRLVKEEAGEEESQ